jgi:hypothetical protein
MKKIVILMVTMFCFASSVYAVPSLQLGPDTDNLDDWRYDSSIQTWVTDTNPFSIYAYATDDAWDAGATYRYAYLVVSAIPKSDSDGSDLFNVLLENDGDSLSLLASDYGVPPIEDPNDIAPHAIFPTYFEIYGFQFDQEDPGTIPNTQPGHETDSGSGYEEMLSVNIISLDPSVTGLHMDLFTVSGSGIYPPSGLDAAADEDLVKAFAPPSHDAQTVVPEPTTLLLVGSGLIGLAAFKRRVRKR